MESSANMAQWEEHLSIYFKGSTEEIGGDYDFDIMCNEALGGDEEGHTQDMIYEAEWRLVFQLAPSPEIRAPRFARNMYAESYPEIFYFRLAVVDGNAKMVQGRFPQQQDSHFHLTTEDKFEWPRCLARNIVESKSLWLIRT